MFYHGTSSALPIGDEILPPTTTQRLSEVGRRKNLDKVFFTQDFRSAEIYAKKAVKRFGGEPIVYAVIPEGLVTIIQSTPGTSVIMADRAIVSGLHYVATPTRKAA